MKQNTLFKTHKLFQTTEKDGLWGGKITIYRCSCCGKRWSGIGKKPSAGERCRGKN